MLRGDFLDALRSLPARRLLQAAGSGAAAGSADATAAYFTAVEESARASVAEPVSSRRRAGRSTSCTCLLPSYFPCRALSAMGTQAEGSGGALAVLTTAVAALYLFLQANLTGCSPRSLCTAPVSQRAWAWAGAPGLASQLKSYNYES